MKLVRVREPGDVARGVYGEAKRELRPLHTFGAFGAFLARSRATSRDARWWFGRDWARAQRQQLPLLHNAAT